MLEEGQAQGAKNCVRDGIDIKPATNLAQVYAALTGDARIERVIAAYCQEISTGWTWAREDPSDMKYYVEPHYSLLVEGEGHGPLDSSQIHRLQVPGGPRGPRYEPVATTGDSAEDELVKLVQSNRRLCISEDSGAGKTIFTRRLQAFLCGDFGRKQVLDGKPCLVVRFERLSYGWPADFRKDLVSRLAELVQPYCTKKSEQESREVAQWAIDHDRVVLILDALDQVTDKSCVESLHEFLTPPIEKTPRMILTCRSFAVTKWPGLFAKLGWRHGRIEGFNVRQQCLCLWDVFPGTQGIRRPATEDEGPSERECYDALNYLVADYDEVAEILRVPQVLAHIRQLHWEGRLRPFHSRGDLYQQMERAVLEAAAVRLLGERPPAGKVRQWRRLIAAAAFEMMSRKTHYDYAVTGAEVVDIQEAGSRRCQATYDFRDWQEIEEASQCTNRQFVEGSTGDFFGFKHRGAMEYYCALHLIDNVEPGWVRRATDEQIAAGRPPIRCGEPALAKFANDPDWHWAYRFAIELATDARRHNRQDDDLPAQVCPNGEKTLASLAELYLPRAKGQGPRPTELIFRAWHLFELDLLALWQKNLNGEQGRTLLLPGAEQVVAHYRCWKGRADDMIDALKTKGFVRCPKRHQDDNKPFLMGSWAREGDDIEGPVISLGDTIEDLNTPIEVVVAPFEMQARAVTQGEYSLFDPEFNRVYAHSLGPADDYPLSIVSWHEAFAFAKWVGAEYRLPREVEWAYARRAGTASQYDVSCKRSNPWGLRDMHDKLWEWCWKDTPGVVLEPYSVYHNLVLCRQGRFVRLAAEIELQSEELAATSELYSEELVMSAGCPRVRGFCFRLVRDLARQ